MSASSFFESEVGESWNDVEFCSDTESISAIADLVEAQLPTEQLNRAIVSVFTPNDAKELASIVLDWTKHVDNKYVRCSGLRT